MPGRKLHNSLFRSSMDIPNSSDDDSDTRSNVASISNGQRHLEESMRPLIEAQQQTQTQLSALRMDLRRLTNTQADSSGLGLRDWFVLISILVFHLIAVTYAMKGKR